MRNVGVVAAVRAWPGCTGSRRERLQKGLARDGSTDGRGACSPEADSRVTVLLARLASAACSAGYYPHRPEKSRYETKNEPLDPRRRP